MRKNKKFTQQKFLVLVRYGGSIQEVIRKSVMMQLFIISEKTVGMTQDYQ